MNRHERRRARKFAIEAEASPKARVMAFIDAFHAAPNDTDIEVRIGASAVGEAAVLVTFQGKDHAFFVSEARTVARIMEDVMNEYPHEPEAATLPNIIMSLRAGCDAAEQHVAPQN